MSTFETVMTYVGGGVSLFGLAFAATFVGYRSADPLVESFFGPLSIVVRLVGVAVGLCLVAIGLRVAVQLGDEERVAAAFENGEE
ncbi:hypothetical protein [Halolamina salifodinae]|uniref:Uncharacterized protein n=1 Tax=Halolamina salifodinae TaxID=1202767 RepID=A0A8T4GV45_9EURY|nr:hypothetical protein [Halolamina salifodinae]MBP1985564.1 hypothetical protein [Halolamina salifodinae]